MRFQLALVTACGLFLTACHSTQPTTHLTQLQAKKTPFSTANSVSTKRINTTECNDADDWYLDGFRVGKSFHSQKTEMLQQRMHFANSQNFPNLINRIGNVALPWVQKAIIVLFGQVKRNNSNLIIYAVG